MTGFPPPKNRGTLANLTDATRHPMCATRPPVVSSGIAQKSVLDFFFLFNWMRVEGVVFRIGKSYLRV